MNFNQIFLLLHNLFDEQCLFVELHMHWHESSFVLSFEILSFLALYFSSCLSRICTVFKTQERVADLVLGRPSFPEKCLGQIVEVRYTGGGWQASGGCAAWEKVWFYQSWRNVPEKVPRNTFLISKPYGAHSIMCTSQGTFLSDPQNHTLHQHTHPACHHQHASTPPITPGPFT